jgi:hypothetical protein
MVFPFRDPYLTQNSSVRMHRFWASHVMVKISEDLSGSRLHCRYTIAQGGRTEQPFISHEIVITTRLVLVVSLISEHAIVALQLLVRLPRLLLLTLLRFLQPSADIATARVDDLLYQELLPFSVVPLHVIGPDAQIHGPPPSQASSC